MRISIFDIIFICVGLIFGIYEVFFNQSHRYSKEIAGVLSIILSLWISISCVRTVKNNSKL